MVRFKLKELCEEQECVVEISQYDSNVFLYINDRIIGRFDKDLCGLKLCGCLKESLETNQLPKELFEEIDGLFYLKIKR